MIKFTYTKDNGEITEREGIVLKEPRENFLMADVSDMAMSTGAYVQSWLEAHRKVEQLFLESVDGFKYRTFKPGNMQIKS